MRGLPILAIVVVNLREKRVNLFVTKGNIWSAGPARRKHSHMYPASAVTVRISEAHR